MIQDPNSAIHNSGNVQSSYVKSSNVSSSWTIKFISGIGLVFHDNHNNNFGI